MTVLRNSPSDRDPRGASQPRFRAREERLQIGKALCATLPRGTLGLWAPASARRDPLEILEASNRERLPELIPIRYGRMLPSPFAFLHRYRFEAAAVKVVGIGSVGTGCLIGLFCSEETHPLLLQFKAAHRSVQEPYRQKSLHENQGQHVVMEQQLPQGDPGKPLRGVRGVRISQLPQGVARDEIGCPGLPQASATSFWAG